MQKIDASQTFWRYGKLYLSETKAYVWLQD